MSMCPCGSGKSYEKCCAPFHKGRLRAPTPETLMRSRYSAFVLGDFSYIEKTMSGKSLKSFSRKQLEEFHPQTKWLGLQVLSASEEKERGEVHFIALYAMEGKKVQMEETSEFKKKGGTWYYTGGHVKISEL